MRVLASPVIQKSIVTLTCVSVAAWVYLARTPSADACGCFAPPDPSVPIVQTGERIAFAMENGKVTAHIQIQYAGAADEFAWLVPLPAIPEMSLGTDELFTQLIATTQPKYRVNREYQGACEFDPSRNQFPAGGDSADPSAPEDGGGPLVSNGSIGPFDFAVLRADNQQEMLDWLAAERFFVPAGTDQAVTPYIRPGAYFLALKLQKGQETGDIQPVVITYDSELPMIPIVLTSVAADPDMGVLVWVLGESRAIPRNYFHTQINDAAIDWLNFGANYVDVVTRAVDEASGHHSFVTEYAGTSSIMRDLLDYQGRFGNINELRVITDPVEYINYINNNGYAVLFNTNGPFGFSYSSQALSILDRHLPMPAALADIGVTPELYYFDIGYYLGQFRLENPALFVDLDIDYDPAVLTAEFEDRIVTPTLQAGAMFRDNSYLSRLFTTLSPEEMTMDPVFSFNPDLVEVSNIHESRLIYHCSVWDNDDQLTTPATLITEQGWVLDLPDGEGSYSKWLEVNMPSSLFTEILREEGPPEVVGDNSDAIGDAINDQDSGLLGGCSVASGSGGLLSALLVLGMFFVVTRRRRRS